MLNGPTETYARADHRFRPALIALRAHGDHCAACCAPPYGEEEEDADVRRPRRGGGKTYSRLADGQTPTSTPLSKLELLPPCGVPPNLTPAEAKGTPGSAPRGLGGGLRARRDRHPQMPAESNGPGRAATGMPETFQVPPPWPSAGGDRQR